MPQLDQDYLFLPHRLTADLQMNPAAIGVYALIALASQRTLAGDGAPPTEHGRRKLGLEPSSSPLATPPGQPLFFVDHALIPDPISGLIPVLIPLGAAYERLSSAAECARSHQETHPPCM